MALCRSWLDIPICSKNEKTVTHRRRNSAVARWLNRYLVQIVAIEDRFSSVTTGYAHPPHVDAWQKGEMIDSEVNVMVTSVEIDLGVHHFAIVGC